MARVRKVHGGRDCDAGSGTRMTGEGVRAQLLSRRFHQTATRHGLNRQRVELDLTQFRKPLAARADGQRDLFA